MLASHGICLFDVGRGNLYLDYVGSNVGVFQFNYLGVSGL